MAFGDPKQKKCKVCGTKFMPRSSLAAVCSQKCAIEFSKTDAATKLLSRAKKTQEKEDRAKHRKQKEALKTVGQWKKEAQAYFNKFIRLRDRDEPCISCGRTNEEVGEQDPYRPGGYWDCGHFRSVGACEELRFCEDNAYKQCKSCNGGSGKYAKKAGTVAKEYEARLRVKVGDKLVDWIQGPHEPARYRVNDLKEIKAKYMAKCRELEKELNQ